MRVVVLEDRQLLWKGPRDWKGWLPVRAGRAALVDRSGLSK
jgi:hypothetical protein